MCSRQILSWLVNLAFVVLLGVGMSVVSDIVHYKSRYEKVVKTFMAEPRGSYDVIAFGSSHMYCTLSPIELFRGFGVRSYVLATRRQPLAVSYGYAKMALERQRPQVVILETYMFVNNENYFRIEDGVAHDSLDPVPLGCDKMEMMSAFEHEGAPEDYVFPFMKYHARWKELNKQDFLIDIWRERDFCKGFKLFCRARPTNAKAVDYKSIASCPIREEYLGWIDKIQALAASHGAKLMLLLSPYDIHYSSEARMAKSLRAYAKARGILFLDMNEKFDALGLNCKKDFFDSGHLNVYGADKATEFVGRYLTDKCLLKRSKISEAEKKIWADDIAKYDRNRRRLEIKENAKSK